jgi:transcriptional regulator with XRE-family HTH domain
MMVKLTFDIPRRMKIAAQEIGTSGNPDAICFECPFRGDTCGGANETAMSMTRRVEWYKRLAKENNITRAQAAEISGIPLDTINSVMTGRTEDPRHSTLQAISKAYNGGCWGKYPCHIAALLIRGELEDDSSDERESIKFLIVSDISGLFKFCNIFSKLFSSPIIRPTYS